MSLTYGDQGHFVYLGGFGQYVIEKGKTKYEGFPHVGGGVHCDLPCLIPRLTSCGSHDNMRIFPMFYIGNQYQGHSNVKMLVMAMGANKELMYDLN